MPDLNFEVVTMTSQDERCAVQWRLTGTFAGPGSLGGIAPTGDHIVMEGIDLLTVKDGLIQSNDAFPDSIALPRQLGMLPPQGSLADQRLTGAFNAKTRLTTRLSGSEAQIVASGVWVVQGQPARCNVYLIEDEGGVTMFDAGARTMTRALARAGAKLGGIRRIVLGHGHTDHRGAAPAPGRTGLLPRRRGAGRRRQRRLSLLAGGSFRAAVSPPPGAAADASLRLGRRPRGDRRHGCRGR